MSGDENPHYHKTFRDLGKLAVLDGPQAAEAKMLRDSVFKRVRDPDATTIGAFAESLLNQLAAINFSAGPWIAWSQHNHLDIELDRLYADTALKYIGDKLTGHSWVGWRETGDTGPRIFLTEGGGRLAKIDSKYYGGNGSPSQLRNKQSALVQNTKGRIMGSPYPAMWLYYMFTSNVDYDCGLRDPYSYPTQGQII